MKLFLLIQDDPLFLYDRIPGILDNFEVIGASILSQKLPRDNYIKTISRYLYIFGMSGFLKLAFKTLYNKYLLGKDFNKLFINRGLNIVEGNDINSKSFVEYVKSLKPDLLVSIACPQIIRNELIITSQYGAINLHGGYLPDFAGVFTPFWNLYKSSPYAGCTVHWINESIDGGDIIKRASFPISAKMSMLEIYDQISSHGIILLAESIESISNGTAETIKNDWKPEDYNSFPTRQQGRQFRKRGLKAI